MNFLHAYPKTGTVEKNMKRPDYSAIFDKLKQMYDINRSHGALEVLLPPSPR